MKKDNSISSLTRSQGKLCQHSGGSIMLNIIIIIVIFASIISAVVYMSSSSLRQAVSSNQGANAWNMAEAGYRFLSVSYIKTANTSGLATADYDKAEFLRNKINNSTYVIPNNGSFKLTVKPYWFYNTATATKKTFSVNLPGTAAFTALPGTGQIKIGNTAGSGIMPYTGGGFNSTTGVFTFTLASNTKLNKGDSVYLVLNPPTGASGNQTLIPGGSLNLNLNTFPQAAFPARDGLIEIGSETRLYRYSWAKAVGSVLTLYNLRHSDNSPFPTGAPPGTNPVTTATTVTFKKYLMATSQGKVAKEERTLSFSQAILDSIASTAQSVILNDKKELEDNFTRSSSVGSNYDVANLTVSGGGKAWFSIIKSLSGAAPRCGAFWYSNTSLINTLWGPPPVGAGLSLLSYDVQVKMATGNALTAGTLGLAIRAKKFATGATEPDTYLGLTFMKYNLANLYFTLDPLLFFTFTNGGTTAISSGNTVVGARSGATGVVNGTPVLTSGSWAGGDAAGTITFSSVTGTFSVGEGLMVGGVNRAIVSPLLFTNGGTTAINSGDTLTGASSGATGVVQGTPVLTSGSWAGGCAAGKIIFSSVTGTFSAGEWLMVGGVNRAKVSPTINLFNPGDTLTGVSSGATGVVQGMPEITSGSWAGCKAKGKIRFASVTGTFSANERLMVGGVPRVQVNGSNYFPAATDDYIPSAIKPKPSDFGAGSPFYCSRYNIGPLLMVLWELQSNGTFRWLAFKDISNDDYVKGLQDFVEPAGSCATTPPSLQWE